MRERDRDDEAETVFPVGAPGGIGGEILVPGDRGVRRETTAEEAMEDEEDIESPEGDDELLNPGSPEFEHLEKPHRSQ